MEKAGILRPPDDEIRAAARTLLAGARFGALAVLLQAPTRPFVTRIAVLAPPGGAPIALVSGLSRHTGALAKNPACSLMVGEPGSKGDPLAHPRLSLECRAEFIRRDSPEFPALRGFWLEQVPKARLYADFADFSFVRFRVTAGFLNGGFGLASALSPADLGIEPDAAPA
ncbi:MAG TPA: pyridoxamine 5-phosphate oxidase [Aliiroseovarius sp.]|nr:pyridoxamine 5-phosphate oxidase [Aliiroseovarius sp.]